MQTTRKGYGKNEGGPLFLVDPAASSPPRVLQLSGMPKKTRNGTMVP